MFSWSLSAKSDDFQQHSLWVISVVMSNKPHIRRQRARPSTAHTIRCQSRVKASLRPTRPQSALPSRGTYALRSSRNRIQANERGHTNKGLEEMAEIQLRRQQYRRKSLQKEKEKARLKEKLRDNKRTAVCDDLMLSCLSKD